MMTRMTLLTSLFAATTITACSATPAPSNPPAPTPTAPVPTTPTVAPAPAAPTPAPIADKGACGLTKTRLELTNELALNQTHKALIRNVDDRDFCSRPWRTVCGSLEWTVTLTSSTGVTFTANIPDGHYRCPAVKRPRITEFRLAPGNAVTISFSPYADWYLVKENKTRPHMRAPLVRAKLKPGSYTLRISGGPIAHEIPIKLVK